MHGIRYKLYLIENYDDDDINDDNDDNDDNNDHYICNSVTRSHKAHLFDYLLQNSSWQQLVICFHAYILNFSKSLKVKNVFLFVCLQKNI